MRIGQGVQALALGTLVFAGPLCQSDEETLVRGEALDVVQLHKCLLEGVLKLSEESIRNQQNLSYVREASEALATVRTQNAAKQANIVFLMNPCPVQKVRDIAFAGEVMPQKSTDFYPKLLSGLTAYALD